ncbi:MAG: hypothetical protein AB7F96_13365 [Beijerinckiaceae bacterium]
MKTIVKYLVVLLTVMAAAIFSLQFVPPVSKALALAVEYEAALAAKDAATLSRLSSPGVFSDLDRARKHALFSSEQEVRRLPFADRLLALTFRAAVIDTRLDLKVLQQGSPAELHVALLSANAKLSGAPPPRYAPLFGIPTGPGRVSVWIGAAQVPSYLTYVLSVAWNLRGEVIAGDDGRLVFDPAIMQGVSARENAKLLDRGNGPQSDKVILAYLKYTGAPDIIWRPLDVPPDGKTQ